MDYTRSLFYGSQALLIVTGTAALWSEAVGLALFIEHLGIHALPLVLISEALISMILLISIPRLYATLHEAALAALITLLALGMLLVGRFFIHNDQPEIGYSFYYLIRCFVRDGLIVIIWGYVSSFYEASARYLLPRVLLLSRTGVGIGVWILALLLSQEDMIWLWGGSLVASLIMIGIFVDEFHIFPRASQQTTTSTPRFSTIFWGIMRSDLMIMLVLTAFAAMLISTLIFYYAADIFQETFSTENSLVRWLAFLYGASLILTAPIQGRLIPYFLRRRTLPTIANTYPAFLGIAFISVISLPLWMSGALAEGIRLTLHLSLFDPLRQYMKKALPISVGIWERDLLHGIIEPAARLIGALLLILWVENWISRTSIISLGILIVLGFAYSQFKASAFHSQAVNKSIASGQYGFLRASILAANQEIVDKLLENLKALSVENRQLLLLVQALAESGSQEGFNYVMSLWPRCPTSVQAELLIEIVEGWSRYRTSQAVNVIITEALESESMELRRAALLVMLNYPNLLEPFRVAPYLIDPEPAVSTLAAHLLLDHSQLGTAAKAQLNWLSRAGLAETRALAVNAFVNGGVNRFGERFVPLDTPRFQADLSARVRMAVVPGCTLSELINSIQDTSPSVRQLALQRLQQTPLRAAPLLESALANLQTPSEEYQIEAIQKYWYALIALAGVNKFLKRDRVLAELRLGMRQIDMLNSMVQILSKLKYTSVAPLIAQLKNDRYLLTQAVFAFMSVVFDQEKISEILRTLQQSPDPESQRAAQHQLAELTTSKIASEISLLCTNPDVSVTRLPETKIEIPRDVIQILLQQHDPWWPLLTLHAISILPPPIFEFMVSTEQVETILENARQNSLDAIREASRRIRKMLKDKVQLWQDESALSRTVPVKREEHMLSTIERMLFLRNVSFFENLRLDQLRTLARICTERAFNSGETIIRKGEAGDSLFVVVEGQVKIIDESSGKQQVLATLEAGDVMGEISLFDGGLRSADGIAQSECLMMEVRREALDDALADDPGIALDMLRVMAQRIRLSNQQLSRMSQRISRAELEV